MEHLGGVYVINLDRRTDRLEEFQEEMDMLQLPFKRFPGILKTPGTVGCGMSHLAILKEARDLGLKNVLIFEDDFMLQVSKDEFWGAVDDFFKTEKDYDVFLLAAWIKKKTDHSDKLFRVQEAQGASAYIVNSWFYDPLIELYEETLPKLEATGAGVAATGAAAEATRAAAGAGAKAGTAAAPSPSSTNTTDPCLTLSPILTLSSLTTPPWLQGISMEALSLSTVIRLWSDLTVSPTLTINSITVTSSKSPMSGTLISMSAMFFSRGWGPSNAALGSAPKD